jgi:hypothetical protein
MPRSDDVIELFKDLEAALAIVRTSAAKKLGLTLQKAEVEVELSVTASTVAGAKFDIGVSVDAGVKKDVANVHLFSLSLEPKDDIGSLGSEETHDLAQAIVEIAQLRKEIAGLNSKNFSVGSLKLSISFERTTEGKLQIIGGGGRTSQNVQRLNLTFRPSFV